MKHEKGQIFVNKCWQKNSIFPSVGQIRLAFLFLEDAIRASTAHGDILPIHHMSLANNRIKEL